MLDDEQLRHELELHLNGEGIEFDYLSHKEARSYSLNAAARDLIESETCISYVAYLESFDDYCRCQFTLEEKRGWLLSCRMLGDDERLPEERITDARIVEVADRGGMLNAIRLYRAKYHSGLAEAKTGVESLIRGSK